MRMYAPANLIPHDPTSRDWALAWARRFAGDVPPWRPGSLEDEEWLGWLQATALVIGDATYYRPHEAAARAIESDPNRLQELAIMGAMQRMRDPLQVARAIRNGGRWVDELIRERTGATINGDLRVRW